MSFTPRCLLFSLALTLCGFAAVAHAGTIELTDGTVIEGNTSWAVDGKLVVAPTGLPSQSFDVAKVRKAIVDFKPVVAATQPDPEWQKRTIGYERLDGSAAISAGRITVRDNITAGLRTGRRTSDSCYYVYQKLDGDCEIVARIMPKDEFRVVNRASVMMRETLEPNCAMVFVSRGGDFGDGLSTNFIARPRSGERADNAVNSSLAVLGATWLKLARKGDTVTAFDSADGKKWHEIGSSKLTLLDPRSLYVGVASASSGAKGGLATFDKVSLAQNRAPSVLNNLPLPDTYALTRSGSVIAGPMVSCSDTEFKLERDGVPLSIPVKDLALYQITALSRDLTDKLLKSPAGVMTKDGDFIEGDVKSIVDGTIRLSSIEFGITNVEVWKTAAIVFAPFTKSKANIEVRLQDRSVLHCRSISLDKGELLLEDISAGVIKVPPRQVLYIERQTK